MLLVSLPANHHTYQWPISGLLQMNWLKSTLQNKKHRARTDFIQKAPGNVAEVCSPIPPHQQGTGQIMIASQGGLRKFKAVTGDETDLLTGAIVIVTDVIDTETVKVTRSK
ncbi:hypothetical protein [Marinoscillum furvescens]|uniref:Uncharacterized protein n=1 Tax=Marinoscillum furvescens DSM 4134 TaxID=1122208 RepID=A0A3D9LH52_MARFU|nr:hypothetical protein [Marinoscillum furvescens]REE05938.1 hypothetical protein C7460_101457 [Marinoscillum furvescens DSM 4134]